MHSSQQGVKSSAQWFVLLREHHKCGICTQKKVCPHLRCEAETFIVIFKLLKCTTYCFNGNFFLCLKHFFHHPLDWIKTTSDKTNSTCNLGNQDGCNQICDLVNRVNMYATCKWKVYYSTSTFELHKRYMTLKATNCEDPALKFSFKSVFQQITLRIKVKEVCFPKCWTILLIVLWPCWKQRATKERGLSTCGFVCTSPSSVWGTWHFRHF